MLMTETMHPSYERRALLTIEENEIKEKNSITRLTSNKNGVAI